MKEKLFQIICTVALLGILYFMFGSSYSPTVNPADNSLTEEEQWSVMALERGFYNDRLPVFALRIDLEDTSEEHLRYQVTYFPAGKMEREWVKEDGEWVPGAIGSLH